MFDLGVFVGPGIVLAAMLVAWVGFIVWGGRAIRESAERAEQPPVETPLAPTVDAEAEQDDAITLLTDTPELERTAEFAQPSFAQSFLEGEELDPADVDYNAAIDRITADLDAAEAAGVEPAAAAEPVADAADVSAAQDDDMEATRLLSADELPKEDGDIEATRVLQPAEAAAIAADAAEDAALGAAAVGAVAAGAAVVGAAAAGEALDKAALEETRLINKVEKMPQDEDAPQLPVFGEGAENETSRHDALFPEQPLPFGPKMAWLAVPGYQPSEVIAALRLGQVEPANWTKGLTEAYADNNRVFVSPTLSGWVLVIGKTLWQKADMNRSAENIQWLKDVGRMFGNACFFSTMRGLGNHGWVGIRGGSIARAYGYSGELQELIWLVGEPTEEEIAVNPAFATEAEERRLPGFRPVIPDEKMVLAMAAAWSVDVTFAGRNYPPDFGFLGTL